MKKPRKRKPGMNHSISMTDHQWNSIKKWAAEAGMSASAYVAHCMLTVDLSQKRTTEHPLVLDSDQQRQIARTAHDMAEIARSPLAPHIADLARQMLTERLQQMVRDGRRPEARKVLCQVLGKERAEIIESAIIPEEPTDVIDSPAGAPRRTIRLQMKRLTDVLHHRKCARLLLAALLAVSLLALLAASAYAETLTGHARVIDGDTLAVAGQRVRLDAIDAPETRQTCRRNGHQWACGKAATTAMRKLIGRSTVRCEVSRHDKYGRAIAACFINGRDLQQQLVQQGLALAYREYSTRHVPAEDEAREAQRGLWSGSFIEPWRWRRHQKSRSTSSQSHQPQTAPSQSAGACLIKGNISASGRIYHVPRGMYYDRTRIDESRGERWFCNEAEARAAGWRRSGR